ncbi:Angiotensin-converting enzyme [Trichinella spiralis]|uniref:Angiotensin-converting enzyme n=1 Tax=Trichinella spiralis TaxID=6334 RepID=A0ABR3KDD3_TRISP
MAYDMPNAGVPSADTTIHNECLHQAYYFKHRGIHVQQEQSGEPVTEAAANPAEETMKKFWEVEPFWIAPKEDYSEMN